MLTPMDDEARVYDQSGRVASTVTSTGQFGPKKKIGQTLDAGHETVGGQHMLIEPQLASGADDASQLGQCLGGVPHRAKDQ